MSIYFSMDGDTIRLHVFGRIIRLPDKQVSRLASELTHFLKVKTFI